MNDQSPVFVVSDVEKIFQHRTIFQQVSFSVAPGDFILLRGANGVGKSTLLRILLGILRPNRGNVLLWGDPVWKRSSFRKQRVAAALEKNFLYSDLSVNENLQLYSRTVSSTVSSILDEFGLSHCRQHRVKNLSQGIAQRVSLVRCFLQPSDVLLLDEPFSHLDKNARLQLSAKLKQYRVAGGTIVCTSHDEESLGDASTRILTLHRRGVQEERCLPC